MKCCSPGTSLKFGVLSLGVETEESGRNQESSVRTQKPRASPLCECPLLLPAPRLATRTPGGAGPGAAPPGVRGGGPSARCPSPPALHPRGAGRYLLVQRGILGAARGASLGSGDPLAVAALQHVHAGGADALLALEVEEHVLVEGEPLLVPAVGLRRLLAEVAALGALLAGQQRQVQGVPLVVPHALLHRARSPRPRRSLAGRSRSNSWAPARTDGAAPAPRPARVSPGPRPAPPRAASHRPRHRRRRRAAPRALTWGISRKSALESDLKSKVAAAAALGSLPPSTLPPIPASLRSPSLRSPSLHPSALHPSIPPPSILPGPGAERGSCGGFRGQSSARRAGRGAAGCFGAAPWFLGSFRLFHSSSENLGKRQGRASAAAEAGNFALGLWRKAAEKPKRSTPNPSLLTRYSR